MSRVLDRVPCVWHQEDTPSLVIYEDGSAFCYGCNHYEKNYTKSTTVKQHKPTYVTDVKAQVEYIQTLSKREIRGLYFHCNDFGYYVLWPLNDYYKFRAYRPTGDGNKYRGPSGVPKPWFFLRGIAGPNARKLLVIEGEINALSARAVLQESEVDILCPGGAGDFYSKHMENNLSFFKDYNSIKLVVDSDKAGAIAGIKLKSLLTKINPKTDILLMERDYNDILVHDGPEQLRQKIEETLGLCGGLYSKQQTLQAPGGRTSSIKPREEQKSGV